MPIGLQVHLAQQAYLAHQIEIDRAAEVAAVAEIRRRRRSRMLLLHRSSTGTAVDPAAGLGPS